MCGIAGFSGNFDDSHLRAMSHAISHRGPDDADLVWMPQIAGLAHRRLAIIDLSPAGKQPMSVHCRCCGMNENTETAKRIWLIYNGELYNYRELRDELKQKGHVFHSQSDSEIIIHLYAEMGPAFLSRLNGIFALALYDGREMTHRNGIKAGDVLLARDGLGVKPLYYAMTKQGILFASELKALLTSSIVSRDLDLTALHYYLAYLWCPAPLSPLKQVKKVLPGEALLLRQNAIVKQWCFYDLPYHQPKTTQTKAAITAELTYHLKTAVNRQLVSDVPVGAFLSGGLDSSAIVSMMRELAPGQRIRCYNTAVTDRRLLDGFVDDLPYAKQVAKHLNVDLKIVTLQSDMIHQLPRILFHLDEPQADLAPINALLVAEEAKRDGIRVLLSGAGGDDIFSGYRRHYALQTEYLWSWLPIKLRKKIKQLAQVADKTHPLLRRLAKIALHMDLPPTERLASYFLWSSDCLRRNLYSPMMQEALMTTNTLQPLLQSLATLPSDLAALDKMLYLESKYFLTDHNLNYTDKVSMAVGVEVRVPLLDPDLVAFAARVPVKFKQQGRVGKAIFKKAMEPYLPANVIYRQKTGFGAPLRYWLQHDLKPYVHDILSSTRLQQRGLFDPAAVQNLLQADTLGKVDGGYTIFSLLCIELWCQMFVDKSVPGFAI